MEKKVEEQEVEEVVALGVMNYHRWSPYLYHAKGTCSGHAPKVFINHQKNVEEEIEAEEQIAVKATMQHGILVKPF